MASTRLTDAAPAVKERAIGAKPDKGGAVEYYAAVAAEYDASYTDRPNRHERLRVWEEFLTRYVKNAALAYDLGCGSGAITFLLARHAARVIGIDGAGCMLDIARRGAVARGLSDRVTFVENRLPIEGDPSLPYTDVVTSSSAIEHMDSISQSLSFARNLLNPGGVLILSMSNRGSLSRMLVRLTHHLMGRPEYLKHLRHFVTAADLDAHLRAAGFTPVEHAYFEGSDRLNRVLGAVLPAHRANNMIIMVARRLPSLQPED